MLDNLGQNRVLRKRIKYDTCIAVILGMRIRPDHRIKTLASILSVSVWNKVGYTLFSFYKDTVYKDVSLGNGQYLRTSYRGKTTRGRGRTDGRMNIEQAGRIIEFDDSGLNGVFYLLSG